MKAEGRAASARSDWSEAVIESVDRAVAAVLDGLLARLDRVGAAGADLDLVRSTLAAIATMVVAGLAVDRVSARALGGAGGVRGSGVRGRRILRSLVPTAAALGAGVVVAALVAGEAEAAPSATGPSSSRSPGSPRR